MKVTNGQRKFGRVAPGETHGIRVQGTGAELGTLVDISCGGLKLEGTTRLELEEEQDIEIELCGEVADIGPIRLSARTRWRRELEADGRWQHGLEFLQPIPPAVTHQLSDLVFRLSS